MKKTVKKGCRTLVRVKPFETIEFSAESEMEIEFDSDEERAGKERQLWREVVRDLAGAMSEWSAAIKTDSEKAVEEFKHASGAVCSRSHLEP